MKSIFFIVVMCVRIRIQHSIVLVLYFPGYAAQQDCIRGPETHDASRVVFRFVCAFASVPV